MTVDGICDLCGKFSVLVIGWWGVGINLCPVCNQEREKKALERVRQSLKETQKP